MKILLVEDDAAMRTTLERAFKRLGWLVNSCCDGSAALAQWQRLAPDIVLLDLSLPDLDGLEVLSRARAQGLTTPVIILTARGTVGDRILGLNTGADDYLPKPFDLDELEARMRALVRARSRVPSSENIDLEAKNANSRLIYYDLCYEKHSRAFYCQEKILDLSPREATLLACLIEQAGQAVTKERLFERVFQGQADVQMEAVEVLAYRLRKKLSHTGVQLVTLRGLGYLLQGQATS
jgi:two-component system, OmpR family, response regulator TctD